MHMLQASEDSGLRGSLEVDCQSVQVSSPSQGVILAVLTGVGLVESEQGMCSMKYSVSTAHAQLEHAIRVHCRVHACMNHCAEPAHAYM